MSTAGEYNPPGEPQRLMWAGAAITDASGEAVFNFPPGLFNNIPIGAIAVNMGQDSIDYFARIISIGPAGAIVHVRQTTGVEVLGLTVLGATANIAGVNVHLIATESG